MTPPPTLEITPEVARADGQGRVANTAGQNGLAGWLVTLAVFVARKAGWEPDLSVEEVAALVGTLATLLAAVQHRRKLRGIT